MKQAVGSMERTGGFGEQTLVANRAGVLSREQRWRFIRVRLAEHALGALTALFVFALVVYGLGLAPALEAIGLALAVVLAASVLLLALHLRPAFGAQVKACTGRLERRAFLAADGWPIYAVTLDGKAFFLRMSVYDALEDGAVYKAYYLERSPRAGGPVLLSVELAAGQ